MRRTVRRKHNKVIHQRAHVTVTIQRLYFMSAIRYVTQSCNKDVFTFIL